MIKYKYSVLEGIGVSTTPMLVLKILKKHVTYTKETLFGINILTE